MKALLYFTKQLFSFSRYVLILNLIGMVFVSLLEGIGILLLIPMLSISGILQVDTADIPFLHYLFFLESISPIAGLSVILGTYILLVAGQALFQRRIARKNMMIQVDFINHLRMETYKGLLQANWGFFMKKRKSDLVNSLTTELGRVSGGTNMFLQLITSAVFTIIQIGVAFWLSPSMTLFVLAAGIILAFFSRSFIMKSRKIGDQTTEIAKNYLAGITDHFNGIKDIKSNSLEEPRHEWLREWCDTIKKEQEAKLIVRTNSQLVYKVTSAILIAVFLFVSVSLFKSQSQQLLIIILIFSRLWPRFTGIQSNLEQIASTIPAFHSIIQLQYECNLAHELSLQGSNTERKPLRFNHRIDCKNVSFKYENTYSLKDINISIPSNQMTAIVGPSGAGKSTLIDILMGLNRPEKGEVLIDGIPLTAKNLLSLRKSISYVPQDPFLFNASIRENLMMIEPTASDQDIWESLEFSSAAEFVKNLPEGLDTLIGDRGIRISGGERQRIVLARAILRKPSILVLDEATSALDSENESKIQKAIEQLKGKMTIIVIAHRLSTIRKADQVIVLDKGRVVQSGPFTQLAKEKKSMFRNLLEKQTGTSL
ncbi:ABC transporter ATP-binding protein [Rossellomorea aquimaris]|uniref:ATP-binding cassette subfamily C protein n=1 Tax=Rossellomorea aquimaris TaxID=189382 RepID=A0A366ELB8_9BACI|nr:ABC transporter ATP-binding protein [Rossellomorea aquimaris]RBP03168.1 ATP-binding cassette subfamily C protein [Rossellomorea aquimaris]